MTGKRESQLIFFVNGKKVVENNPSPRTLLVEYLRYTLKLTGAKIACGEGACGSCTVLLSKYDRSTSKIIHYAVNSCITPLYSVHGLAVTTVEGLGGSASTSLHPIQEQLVKSHGVQCGYCSTGMVMSMYALIKNCEKPSELQIENALKGNLCRCTGYRPILDAFKSFVNQPACPMGARCCKVVGELQASDPCGVSNEYTQTKESTQDLIFPSELQLTDQYDKQSLIFSSDSVTWHRPSSLNELLILKNTHPEAVLEAGATSLVHKLKEASASSSNPVVVISVSNVDQLLKIEQSESGLTFGAMTSMDQLNSFLRSLLAKLPEDKTRLVCSIIDIVSVFGSQQIRNRATIGGGLALASPLADLNTVLLATDSIVHIASLQGGRRTVALKDAFFQGKGRTCLQPHEVIVCVFIPFSKENEYFECFKQSTRQDMAATEVTVAMKVEFKAGSDVIADCHLVFAGLSDSLVSATAAAKAITGRKWDESVLKVLVSEVKKALNSDKVVDDYKLSAAQGILLKLYLKIYEKLQHKLSLPALSEDHQIYLKSLTDEPVHAGTQVYEIPDGQTAADTVGMPIPHRWAKQCTTGEAVYVDDMTALQGELCLALVTSTKANARILSVDASNALTMPGVFGFIDHHDVKKDGSKKHAGHAAAENTEIFASEHVHWVGQTIGAILAESHDQARSAAKAVVVTYEEHEAIITIEDAISKNSYHNFPFPAMGKINYGDAKTAFTKCDHVLESEVSLGGQEHFYMETHSARVVPRGEDDELDVFCGSQCPTETQEKVARTLGIMQNKVYVHTKRMGGSFGGKEGTLALLVLPSAIAAKRFKRPVRCMLDRNLDMQITQIRKPFLAKYKVGFNKNGKVEAFDMDIYTNDGYILGLGFIFTVVAEWYINNCYAIPNMTVRAHLCKTNLPQRGPMRGAGAPEGVFLCEALMSEVAAYLDIQLHKVVELNMYRCGDMSLVNVPIDACLEQCFRDVVKMSNFEVVRKEIDEFNSKSSHIKKGLSVVPIKGAPGIPARWWMACALINVYLDGSILLQHGGVESGQGLHTKMIQIASRALDVDIDKIHFSETCTSIIPNAVVTAGSSGTDIYSMAVLRACEVLAERLKPFKTANPTGSWEDWIQAAHAAKVNLSAAGFSNETNHEDFNWMTGEGRLFPYLSYGAAVCQVEVDCLTGSHKIIKVDIVMDVGKSLNPGIDVGQIEGAFVQGVGLYALENHEFGPDGFLRSSGARKYYIPTVSSIPLQMNVTLLKDSENPHAIYSSKAIGEPPLLLSISVYLAIRDAVLAARHQKGLSRSFRLNGPATVKAILSSCGNPFTA